MSLSHFQSRVDEVYFVRENTVFAWSPDAEIRQIGEAIPELARIVLSPTGDHFLYTTYREEVTKLLEAECPCGGTTPTGAEFWLMDADTGEQTLIVRQPETIANLGEVRYYGQAVWSPDGQQIAWVEGLEYSDLYVYDLAASITTLVQKAIPSTAIVSNIAEINRWTSTGIWFEYVTYDDDFAPIETGYHIYDPAGGGIISEIPEYAQIAGLPEVNTQRTPRYDYGNNFNITDSGLDIFITHSLTGWQMVNVSTGAVSTLESGIIVQVAAAAPETSIRIYPSIISDERAFIQEVYNSQGELITILNGGFTLSRDGTFLLTGSLDDYLLIIYNNGETARLELPWSYDYSVGGRIKSVLERDTSHLWLTSHCSDSDLPFRFPFVGPDDENPMAHVLGTTANNLHSDPSVNSEKTGSMTTGSSLEILEGPVCSDGITWWYVESLDMQRGWTIEGTDNEYWLAPGCSIDYCEVEG